MSRGFQNCQKLQRGKGLTCSLCKCVVCWDYQYERNEEPVHLTCFPKVILSFSERRISAIAPLNLEMALFSPTSFVFINPVLVMWSAWQWVLTVTRTKKAWKKCPKFICIANKRKNSEAVFVTSSSPLFQMHCFNFACYYLCSDLL